MPSITSVLPKLHISILTLSICSLKNMLHSTWCIIASPMFIVPSIFPTRKEFLNFFILNLFSLAKAVSTNRSVALLSNNIFTAILSWLSSFSNFTFIQTFLSSCSVHYTSLTLSVVLAEFILLPNFSGCNTLYKLLEASQELTVLHCLLPTPVAFLLSSLSSTFSNNFWPCGPTFHTHSMFYSLFFSCPLLLHLDLFLDLFDFDWVHLASDILHYCFLLSIWSALLFSHTILLYILLFLTVYFPLGVLHFSPTISPLPCSVSDFYLILPPFLTTLQ